MLKTKVGCLAIDYSEFSFTITLTGYPDHMCWSPDGSYITVLNDVCFLFPEVNVLERRSFHGGRKAGQSVTRNQCEVFHCILFVSLLIAVVQRHIYDQRHAL